MEHNFQFFDIYIMLKAYLWSKAKQRKGHLKKEDAKGHRYRDRQKFWGLSPKNLSCRPGLQVSVHHKKE